jgi:hypothetical protein
MRLLVALVAIALSGCFGLPEGSADFGDQVTIEYVVLHGTTGAPILWSLEDVFSSGPDGFQEYDGASLQAAVRTALGAVPADLAPYFALGADGRPANVPVGSFDSAVIAGGHAASFSVSKSFSMGSGDSGLGFEVERGIVGMLPDEVRTIESGNDPTRGFSQEIERPRWLGNTESMLEMIERPLFEESLGAPTIGRTFQMTQSFDAEVINFTDTEVNVRLVIEESYPADIVGGLVVPRIVGDTFRLELVLTPGAEFNIASTPGQSAPLELSNGAYRSLRTDGDNVVWAFSASPAGTVGQPITVIVTLVEVTQGTVAGVDGSHGARQSAVMPSIIPELEGGHHADGDATAATEPETEPADHADDGHGH